MRRPASRVWSGSARSGLCADFQVMGRAGEPEPNKGAFWDKLTLRRGSGTDFAGGRLTACCPMPVWPGLCSCSIEVDRRAAVEAVGAEYLPLAAAEAKRAGFYDGARVHATRGLADDGRFLPSPCALDGAEAIRAFVLAYGATQNEVWIKAAWKVADFLLGARLRDFDSQSPPPVAGVILSLLALDAEAPNPRLRAALREWGAWLLALPLRSALPSLNADGLHAGLYDCAQAGFRPIRPDTQTSLTCAMRLPRSSRAASHPARLPGAPSPRINRPFCRWPACCRHPNRLRCAQRDARLARLHADPAAAPFLRVAARAAAKTPASTGCRWSAARPTSCCCCCSPRRPSKPSPSGKTASAPCCAICGPAR